MISLTYTIDDDGIWLECTEHGYVKNLGFTATPMDAMRAEIEHTLTDHISKE
jgi:hypothetical protein